MKLIGIVEENYYFVRKSSKKFSVDFRIGANIVSLENFEFYERMSEETNAFSADLVINGIKVGDCSNEGRGGCANYHIYENRDLVNEIRNAISEVDDYCFPKRKLSMADVIDQLASFTIVLNENKITTIARAKMVVETLNKEADKYRKAYA